jgi:hypothetical protein
VEQIAAAPFGPHRHTKKGRRPPKCHPTQVTGSIWPSSVIAASFQCLGWTPAQKSLLRASNQLPSASPTYAALRRSRMSKLRVCSTVLRPYLRVRGNARVRSKFPVDSARRYGHLLIKDLKSS